MLLMLRGQGSVVISIDPDLYPTPEPGWLDPGGGGNVSSVGVRVDYGGVKGTHDPDDNFVDVNSEIEKVPAWSAPSNVEGQHDLAEYKVKWLIA